MSYECELGWGKVVKTGPDWDWGESRTLLYLEVKVQNRMRGLFCNFKGILSLVNLVEEVVTA